MGLQNCEARVAADERCELVIVAEQLWLSPRVLFLLLQFHFNPDDVRHKHGLSFLEDLLDVLIGERQFGGLADDGLLVELAVEVHPLVCNQHQPLHNSLARVGTVKAVYELLRLAERQSRLQVVEVFAYEVHLVLLGAIHN